MGEYRFLAREVVEERPLGDVRLLGDLVDSGGLEAAFLEEPQGGLDDPPLGLFLLALAA